MSISKHKGLYGLRRIVSAETMYDAVMQTGIIPFFAGPVPGYSIEEMVPRECWFTDECLGPWDWKIDLVQSGDIAYGKFLNGGKAAFASARWYKELMNWRRAQEKYRPKDEKLLKIMAFVRENGSAEVKGLRQLLGLNKARVDSLLTKLQMDTLIVTGDIKRVYSGADLHYSGWQRSSFCMPDDLFEDFGADFFGKSRTPEDPAAVFFGKGTTTKDNPAAAESRMPEESYKLLANLIREQFPLATDSGIAKVLG